MYAHWLSFVYNNAWAWFWKWLRNYKVIEFHHTRKAAEQEIALRKFDPKKPAFRKQAITQPNKKNEPIDDYAKDGVPREVWHLCSFYRQPLRTWIETNVDKFAISSHTAFKLDKQALRSYLNMSQIYYQIQKLVPQRIMVKTTWRSDHPIFSVIVD